MGPDKRSTERNKPQFDPHESFLEKLTGQYTDIAIVGLLFFFVLIVLTIALFCYPDLAEVIVTGFLTAFGSFGGFLAGKTRKKKK